MGEKRQSLDEHGVIKALPLRRAPRGARKPNAIAMKYSASDLLQTLRELYGESGANSTGFFEKKGGEGAENG